MKALLDFATPRDYRERGPFTEAQWHAVCKGLGT